ncbi:MAG: TetR/AcrR family transcriptional regulator [Rhodothermaceae bacterium]|nr:TetR/AcrR family transcriptional regulator [Rhodothermaceae bacterium]
MARPRSFNEQEVLDQAVNIFWRKGFADTSIGDLEEALGMGRQSIYNTFGDKRALFVRALQQYYERGSAFISATFSGQRRGLDSIYSYFDAVITRQTDSDERRGCFLVKCLVDHGTSDSEVTSRCKSNESLLVTVFKKALGEALEDQTVPGTIDVEATAMMLSTQTYGLSVMARSGASKKVLKESTYALLKQLVK